MTEKLETIFQFSSHVPEKPLFGEFGRLQRLNIRCLQNEIASLRAEIHDNEGPTVQQIKELRHTLHEYDKTPVTASKDLEYLTHLPKVGEIDGREFQISLHQAFPEISSRDAAPFSTTYRTFTFSTPSTTQKPDAVREFLRKHLYRDLTWTPHEKDLRTNEYWPGEPPLIYSKFVDKFARFIMAFVGGVALLDPMLIMVFHPSLTKSLIVTSLSVLLFATFLALGINSSNQDTLAATATYAAVLVVFVGTSIPSGSG